MEETCVKKILNMDEYQSILKTKVTLIIEKLNLIDDISSEISSLSNDIAQTKLVLATSEKWE